MRVPRVFGRNPQSNWLSRLWDQIQANALVDGPGYRLNRGRRGTVLILLPGRKGGSPASPIEQFRYKSMKGDYLVCRTWDGTTEGSSDIYIAKPETLRKTGWHGADVTYTIESTAQQITVHYNYVSNSYRVATSAGISEHQEIVPRYRADSSIIYAVEVEGLGIMTEGADPMPVGKLDLNADGRQFART